MKTRMESICEILLFVFTLAVLMTLVIILGTGACIILTIIGKWIGIDMFILVTAFIAYTKAWDFIAWIVNKIADREKRKKEQEYFNRFNNNHR